MIVDRMEGEMGQEPPPDEELVTNLTQLARSQLEPTLVQTSGLRELNYSLDLMVAQVAETADVISHLPHVTTTEVGGCKRHELRSNFGTPLGSSITFDAQLMWRMFRWSRLRMLVLFALVIQTRPLTHADVEIHATVGDDGRPIPTDKPTSHRCRYTIPTHPMVAKNAMPDDLLRLMSPNPEQVVHQLRRMVADAGFEIDPAVFDNDPAMPVPTLADIAHELAALQAEGIVGPLDPNGAAMLNGRLVFNGNPAVRTLLPEMVTPAPGEMFSVNPAHAVDPAREPPDGCFKSGKRKADSIATERRKRMEREREIQQDEEAIARLHRKKSVAEKELDEMTEVALDEAMRRRTADAQIIELQREMAKLRTELAAHNGITTAVADMPDGVSLDGSKLHSRRARG